MGLTARLPSQPSWQGNSAKRVSALSVQAIRV